MTLLKPTLALRRLVILKSGGALYDEKFHAGVNIVRGENSSGKSTIADAIFFSLGGDVTNWTKEADAADSVHAELEINSAVYTVSRDLGRGSQPPMDFFEGPYDAAMASRESWLRYPYKRSANTESFSQVMFKLLGIPEQKGESQNNITMHQILRLMYGDQETPVHQIFRADKYDNRDTRTAIAELLLGIDGLEMHELRLRIKELDRRLNVLVAELASIFGVLGKTDDSDVSVFSFQSEVSQIREERESLNKNIEALSSGRDERSRADWTHAANIAAVSLRDVSERLKHAEAAQQSLQFELEDSAAFARTLDQRLAALEASAGMAEYLGAITFEYCPACLTPVPKGTPQGDCHLCHAASAGPTAATGHLRIREELQFQKRESERLFAVRQAKVDELKSEVSRLKAERDRLALELGEYQRRVDPVDAELGKLQKRAGYLDRAEEDLHRKLELANIVQSKIDERGKVARLLEKTRSALESSEAARKGRKESVYAAISELCVNALHRDLPLEEVFQEAKFVHFDFGNNWISVNGLLRFSASSATYLRNSFLFSLFELSLRDTAVRLPRFLLLDNVEDKGMQPQRSARFQEYVVERCELSTNVAHQVIMTTSMISPKLEDSDLCVGPHYDKSRKTLRFS